MSRLSRLSLLLLLLGAGTLLMGAPAQAAGRGQLEPTPSGPSAGESRALQLLSAASRAARSRSYSGTQYVSTWHDGSAASSVADISHSAASGSVVSVRPTAGSAPDSSVTPTPDLDPRLVQLLAAHYDLTVAKDSTCTGRAAHVVEARHQGDPAVAGRFWLDAATSLVLRREIFDRDGRLVRSSAFATLTIGLESPAAATTAVASLDPATVQGLRQDGWQVPSVLGDGLELYDARIRTHGGQPVLHLSYSDGLSTLSLFAQRGSLGVTRMAGFTRQKLGRSAVWVRSASPERVVWGGGGRVFTLLSDAPTDDVDAAVTALPHEKTQHTGFVARIRRGLSRLGSWLNPFD
jgi:sigma-E factor negative regulatory protein RseB